MSDVKDILSGALPAQQAQAAQPTPEAIAATQARVDQKARPSRPPQAYGAA
jgi:hypothetical protein